MNLGGAGESYLKLFSSSLFIIKIAAGMIFGMIKVLGIPWFFNLLP
jgi:hypothetical protein